MTVLKWWLDPTAITLINAAGPSSKVITSKAGFTGSGLPVVLAPRFLELAWDWETQFESSDPDMQLRFTLKASTKITPGWANISPIPGYDLTIDPTDAQDPISGGNKRGSILIGLHNLPLYSGTADGPLPNLFAQISQEAPGSVPGRIWLSLNDEHGDRFANVTDDPANAGGA